MPRILLVEDEMLVRELAMQDLADAGYEVVDATDGERALEILNADCNFDVLFTDIRMPGKISGWVLAEAAKRQCPGLRVIYATGLGQGEETIADGDRLMAKPYRTETMLAHLEELIPRS